MKKLIELLVIAVVVVFATVCINTAFAQERCLDVASVYQMAASLRDADVAPRAILTQLQRYPRVTERERQEAIVHALANRNQSASTAFKAALVACKYGRQ